jgi:hypothetical protein
MALENLWYSIILIYCFHLLQYSYVSSTVFAVFTVFVVSSLHKVVPETCVRQEVPETLTYKATSMQQQKPIVNQWGMSKFSLLADLCLERNFTP